MPSFTYVTENFIIYLVIMMLDYKAIGRRIKYYRLNAGLRQADLAEQLDVSTSYISQLECGVAEISLKRLDSIATLVSCKIQQLIADTDPSDECFLQTEIAEKVEELTVRERVLLIHLIDGIISSREG